MLRLYLRLAGYARVRERVRLVSMGRRTRGLRGLGLVACLCDFDEVGSLGIHGRMERQDGEIHVLGLRLGREYGL